MLYHPRILSPSWWSCQTRTHLLSKTVDNFLEFLRIVVQQLVEEVRAGIHRLPDPGHPNQHTLLGRKVGPTVTAEPLG
ncbi:hypothetical protein TcBrA4_0002590 [Trypanosoma cruzi]|nr:hypothetical protein TcBrA4_0002590 [Trypanosoma cruzi]